MDNLNCYLDSLNESSDHSSNIGRASVPAQRFTETLKFQPNQDSYTIASKLEQAMTKIKEYKLKSLYLEKEVSRYGKREKKMKQCLYEMLEELKHTNSELTR